MLHMSLWHTSEVSWHAKVWHYARETRHVYLSSGSSWRQQPCVALNWLIPPLHRIDSLWKQPWLKFKDFHHLHESIVLEFVESVKVLKKSYIRYHFFLRRGFSKQNTRLETPLHPLEMKKKTIISFYHSLISLETRLTLISTRRNRRGVVSTTFFQLPDTLCTRFHYSTVYT